MWLRSMNLQRHTIIARNNAKETCDIVDTCYAVDSRSSAEQFSVFLKTEF